MPTFVEFNCFSEDLANKIHDLNSDSFKWALTNTQPAATNTVLADITQIANGNGYTTGGTAVVLSFARVGTVTTVSGANATQILATGAVGPFQWIVLYNDTSASDSLIGYVDHGTAITMANTNTYDIPAASLFTIN